MKNTFDKIIKEAIDAKDVNLFGHYVDDLADKFGVSFKTIYTRFKSMYGMSPREYISRRIFPTKEEMSSYVLNSSSSDEVRSLTGLSDKYFTGIYDKYFGVSTFQKAKLLVLNTSYVTQRVPMREDNRSLFYSQILGDGSYDARRHSIRIVHGIKQAEYLRWKVGLLKNAYPKLPTEIKIRKHAQGHFYVEWYSRKLGNIDLCNEMRHVLPKKLTPLGWLLWYLDDGTFVQNYSISTIDKSLQESAVTELKSYGITARIASLGFHMCGQENDLLFYKNFIEPFLEEIPTCMLYKVDDIVG